MEQKIEESEPVHGFFTGFGSQTQRDERKIKTEIKALEIEEKAIKLQRQRDRELKRAERVRESSRRSKSVERVEIGGGVKVERNKKGKMSLVAHK